jgi:hypothetical protein
MRDVSLEHQLTEYPHTVWYIHKFIEYFYAHGIKKRELRTRNIKVLYRGFKNDFTPLSRYQEFGFMSTSIDEGIAQVFARQDGTVAHMKVSKLPNNAPFVNIDEHLAEHLNEEEILFLPGRIDVKDKDGQTFLEYTMDEHRVNVYRGVTHHGGHQKSSKDFPTSYLMNLTISGKWAIIYRALKGRHVEVLANKRIPRGEKKALEYYQKRVFSHLDVLTSAVSYIPAFTDLVKDLKDKVIPEANVKDALATMESYYPKVAIYNPNTQEVEATNFGYGTILLNELKVDLTRDDEIKRAIVSSCSWMERK